MLADRGALRDSKVWSDFLAARRSAFEHRLQAAVQAASAEQVGALKPAAELLAAMRKTIAGKPGEFRAMVATLEKNGVGLDGEGAMKRMPRGFEQIAEPEIAAAVRNRHFVVRRQIDPERIHKPELAEEIVDFTLRAKPLLDWGRKIEGRVARSDV